MPPPYSYLGPGTNLEKYGNFKPYNNIDNCARTHDFDYERDFKIENIEERQKKIREDDNKFLNCIEKHKNEDFIGYNIGKTGINSKVLLEKINPNIVKNTLGEKYVGSSIKKKTKKY